MSEKISIKEELILEHLRDPQELCERIWFYEIVEGNDEIRQAVLEIGNPTLAYTYALKLDRGPTNDMREIACRDPHVAYLYAKYIDGGFSEETYAGVYEDSFYRERYEEWLRRPNRYNDLVDNQ